MNALSQDGVTEYSLPSQNHVTVILKVCDADYLAIGCCKTRRILKGVIQISIYSRLRAPSR